MALANQNSVSTTSTPSFTEFDPRIIPYQYRVLLDVWRRWDYTGGRIYEFLLSGAVGSAKSILGAHLVLKHVTYFNRSRVVLGRQSMPDLKDTIVQKVIEHMEGDFIDGIDYEYNKTQASFKFLNGSEIISRSWADKKYKSAFRSVEASAGFIEELTENDESFKGFYSELRMRIGRLRHVPQGWLGAATNPDSPAHWGYKHWELGRPNHRLDTRKVYYSITTDNPFLAPEYILQLKKETDPKLARRMLYGEWVEVTAEVVYHQYSREHNYRDVSYEYSERYPMLLCFDFNIGVGKPMSACSGQYHSDKDEFHWGHDYVVEGARTEDILEEMAGQGLFDNFRGTFIVHGDATGKHRDTRSKTTDYEIIRKFLANYTRPDGTHLDFIIDVGLTNPPIRSRHNTVNAYLCNDLGERRMYVYKDAEVLDEGFRLVKLKDTGQYIEDDTPYYQHVTTAAGYGVIEQTVNRQVESTSKVR